MNKFFELIILIGAILIAIIGIHFSNNNCISESKDYTFYLDTGNYN